MNNYDTDIDNYNESELLELLKINIPISVLTSIEVSEHLDIIKKELSRHEINVETFDGRVKQKKREEILSSDCEVLILQIKTGCEGLNLQKFNEVYFVSPHWNPAVEEQAIARCHRLGQKKDIHVFHFNMAGFGEDSEAITLDTYASSVQDEKRDIMKLLN